jgi:hypothetical protein
MAVLDSTVAYLTAWSAAFEQHYRPGMGDKLKRHGKTTRIIEMKKQKMDGLSTEYTVKAWHGRGTTVSMDPMGVSPDPVIGDYVTFTPRFAYDTAGGAGNDVAKFEIAFRTTVYDIWKKSDPTFKDSPDFIRKDVEEGMADVKEAFAKHIHMPQTGLLASSTTAFRNSDSDLFQAATDYTAGSSDAFVQLVDGAIALIGDGQILDMYTAAGGFLARVRVSYVNPFEQTIAIVLFDAGATSGPGGVQNPTGGGGSLDVANGFSEGGLGLNFFLRDSLNAAPRGSLAHLFDPTQAYYGRTRVGRAGVTAGYEPKNRLLIPVRVDASGGGAPVNLTGDLFRRVGEVVGWAQGGFMETAALAQIMSRFEFRQISSFIKDEGITITPALESQVGQKLNKAFGFDGFMLHDPNLGTQMMIVDDFAAAGQITFLSREDWEIITPIDGGFRMFPGEIGGIWGRESVVSGAQATPGKTYFANGLLLAAFVCRWPKGQIQLRGLTVG